VKQQEDEMTDNPKCSVRDGKFVEPCSALWSLIDGKRVQKPVLSNLKTGAMTRSFITIHSGEHRNGFAINCCPICGERIDAPFADDEVTP